MKLFTPILATVIFGLFRSGSCATLNNQPVELVSENGLLEVTLDVGLLESLQGIPWSTTNTRIAPAYNGAPVGPTLRVKPGDTLKVTLNNMLDPASPRDLELRDYVSDPASDPLNLTIISNRLDQIGNIYNPTYGYWGQDMVNLHFHGMQFSPKDEDLDVFVAGGETKTYTFEIPEDQAPGVNWYHDHVHGTATHAYMSSLFGFIIVEGTENDITAAPGVQGATEVLMLLSEALVFPDGTPYSFFPVFFTFNWTSVTNGYLPEATTYDFEEGEVALFRVASATVEPTMNLRLPGHTFVLLAQDGIPLPAPVETDVITVGGGGRRDFLVRFDTPGTYVMTRDEWRLFLTDASACEAAVGVPVYPCWSFDKLLDVVTINVNAKADNSVPAPLIDSVELPPIPERLNILTEKEPVRSRDILLKQDTSFPLFQIPYEGDFVPPGVAFGINGKLYTPFQAEGEIEAGTCETWNVMSDPPGFEHPFHTHSVNFRVLEEDGVPLETPVWVDTWTIFGASIKIHVCADRLEPGDNFLFHCHSPNHFDIGMAAYLNVVDPAVDPTGAPVDSPSDPPVDSPSDPPVDPPTDAPTDTDASHNIHPFSLSVFVLTSIGFAVAFIL